MKIIPIKDLRNTNEISERCHELREPIFVTKNGYGDLVLMSIETYEDLTATAEIDGAIAQAEAEIAGGAELSDAADIFAEARRKYFG